MNWDIINILDQPKCILCDRTTKQMARFPNSINQSIYICFSCGPHVKAAMNKWTELKDPNYINTD